jgi:hypothetical protein
MNDITLIEFLLVTYFIIIPFFYNTVWQDSEETFIKWYFKKSECITWFGYIFFLVLGLGSLLYLLLWYIGEILFYVLFLPIIKILEFLFVKNSAKCSDKEREENEIK